MADELQFGRAEYASPAGPQCAACQRPLSSAYYEINTRIICESCFSQTQRTQAQGSGMVPFFNALLFGVGAAIAGAVIYFAVAAMTGYEFGLIAIVVGFMVGWAVRKGSEGRGGVGYQFLAVILTYLAIVSTYIPSILKQFSQVNAETSPVGWMVIFAIACLAPWLAGIRNIVGWIIIGIGLYQAWKFNKRVPLQISGPFSLASRPPTAPASP